MCVNISASTFKSVFEISWKGWTTIIQKKSFENLVFERKREKHSCKKYLFIFIFWHCIWCASDVHPVLEPGFFPQPG